MFSVNVRWQGKIYKVDVDPEDTGLNFKQKLYSQTRVAPDRQKIIIRGGQLKNDTVMKDSGLKPNSTVMMMGTIGDVSAIPVPVQMDIPDNEDMEDVKYPSGLVNLGNTCYMNATLQLLKAIPEVESVALKNTNSSILLRELLSLFQSMKPNASITPYKFLQVLRMQYPQFGEKNDHGGYAQQDAEECWSYLLSILRQAGPWANKNMVLGMHSSMTCDEDSTESATETDDEFVNISCHISMHTSYMTQGILEGLTQQITKRSEKLGRDAKYTKVSRISRLPKYIAVNFVRFYWKQSIGKKAKILRKVKFPFELDAVEFCTPELAQKLVPVRDQFREFSKFKDECERAHKRSKIEATEQEKEQEEEDLATRVAVCQSLVSPDLADDEGASKCGLYDLIGVLSHAGASANSGHYQAWIRNPENKKEWFQFNDDKITVVDQDRIESLDGGGESDSAYILLYRTKELQ
ncbi:ubiquitin carboxy terminal hydrolase Ubp6 [Schizosaccharomyces japonicus yFS275]|uniref:Ubiquitin carboxyl-terminal hydrolase n=1 Tax=Schizosaccharomyces japonicus (strain yFS275 / FY16936) TaxID=402676 RepID=B6K1Y2_SCHJY|nr:ubiquitin carboxy terminal hydrolase Ubp6 [Schizosaccharomyces japonicus yFS275]EEB07163.1 ubiquitin carboxy terminal hydrolase Ubp6 [Schizosaccharomyces japonicus yFS275]